MPTPIATGQRAEEGLRATVAEIVAAVLPQFTVAFAQIVAQAPQSYINVPPSAVQVNVPEADVPDVQVTVPGLVEFAAKLEQTNNLLGRLIYLAEQPETTTVKRNANQQIEQTVRHRG